MKWSMVVLLMVLNPVSVLAMDTQPGYLVFALSRLPSESKEPESYSFKVLLNDDFKSQFKHLPSPTSTGTGFYCRGGKSEPSTLFTWWVRRTSDGKLSINMWGKGSEEVKGHQISSHNPSASQNVTFKTWNDIDMDYHLSYEYKREGGVSLSFEVRYYPASDKALGKIPLAPVRKTDGGVLTPGSANNKNIRFHCAFQEG